VKLPRNNPAASQRRGNANRIRGVRTPLFQAAGVVADVRVTQAVQQAHGLLPQRSRGPATIGDDVRASIGQQLRREPADVGNRQIDRAGDVDCRERFGREDIDEHDSPAAQRADELIARDRRRRGVRH